MVAQFQFDYGYMGHGDPLQIARIFVGADISSGAIRVTLQASLEGGLELLPLKLQLKGELQGCFKGGRFFFLMFFFLISLFLSFFVSSFFLFFFFLFLFFF